MTGTLLPCYIIEAKSVNHFKNLLDNHWIDEKFMSPFST